MSEYKNIIEISNHAVTNVEFSKIEEFIRTENEKLGVDAKLENDELTEIIEAAKITKGMSARTQEDYAAKLQCINTEGKTSVSIAKEFISKEMLIESRDFIEEFIKGSMKGILSLKREDITQIMSYFKQEKAKYDDKIRRMRIERDLCIDSKYTGMYTLHINNKGDDRVRVNPHPDKIADLLLKENHIITFKDTLFIYREGFYRAEPETVETVIIKALNDICKGDNSDNVMNKVSDIRAQITTKSRVHAYPFNHDMNKLPVSNGILVFDFESKQVELIKHDPDTYKFNYMIPVNYSPENENDVIFGIYKAYVENPDILVQMVAQSFLQAMGHGPYKRSYLIYGKKNSGKTTFMEGIEDLIGHAGFTDIGLDEINARFQIASLEGKLLNLHDDMGYFTMKNTEAIKTLTGRTIHKVERKGVQPYEASLTAVHCFTTNTPAKFDNTVKTDAAFWERWQFITFKGNFVMNGEFHNIFTSTENKSALLNRVIDMMLKIGSTGKLPTDIDWYETREAWMLAGNPLYAMIKEIGELDVYKPGLETTKKRGTAIIKDELLTALQHWCYAQKDMDDRMIPDSKKDLAELADACGWERDEQRPFGKDGKEHRCYVIPYIWKKTEATLKYLIGFTEETGRAKQANLT